MSRLMFASVSLVALGVAIILFEGLAENNRANFHPCSPGIICDFVVNQYQISIGIFPVIAGAVMLGLLKTMKRTEIFGQK